MFWLCSECGHKEYIRRGLVEGLSPPCPNCYHDEMMLLWEEEDYRDEG